MLEGIEIRTGDLDLGRTIALWLADLIDEFHRSHRPATVVIDDGGLLGRPFRNGHLRWAEDFRASRDGGDVHFHCSTSSVVFASRAVSGLVRKALVRLRLADDPVPLDHRQVVLRQRRIRQLAQSAMVIAERRRPCRFLLRVDDFPSPHAGLDEFVRFHRIAVEYGVPYMLAATPFLESQGVRKPLSDASVATLQAIMAEGVDLALHGFAHKSRYRNYGTELLSLPAAALRTALARADDYLAKHQLETIGFVAPFNSYDPLTFSVLAERFPLICGGPESVACLGYRAGPSFLMGSLYVPSYRGAYDLGLRRLARFDRMTAAADGLTIPVTTHWANEVRDDFRGFRALCERLHGRAHRWRDFVSSAVALKSLRTAA